MLEFTHSHYIYIYIYIFKGFAPAAGPFTCNNLQIYKGVTRKLQLLNVSDDVSSKLLLCYLGSVCSHGRSENKRLFHAHSCNTYGFDYLDSLDVLFGICSPCLVMSTRSYASRLLLKSTRYGNMENGCVDKDLWSLLAGAEC